MTSRTGWPRVAALVLLAGVMSCGDGGTEPAADVPPPEAPLVEAVGLGAVRVGWLSVGHPDVTGYEIQRRAQFSGAFERVATVVQPGGTAAPVLFFDSDLLPDTYYGYRVVTLTRFDTRSQPSVVRAARTPPVPGIRVETQTAYSSPASVDADGFVVTLLNGSRLKSTAIGLTDSLRFDSLPVGPYQVELSGLAPQCALTGAPTRDAEVVDVGVNTVDTVRYTVACRNPNAGEIVAVVSAEGDSVDANGYVFELVGVAADPTLPDSLRAVIRTGRVPFPPGGSFAFADLLPGDYDVTLTDVAPQCTIAGPATRTSTVGTLESDTLRFAVTCDDGGMPIDSTRPFVWRNQWSADSVASGQPVRLDVALDLRADAAQDVGAVQATLRYDSLVLRYDSIVPAGSLPQLTANGTQRGLLVWGAFTSGIAPKGEVALARAYFTAIGPGNSTARTRTSDLEVAAGDLETRFDSLVRVVEDTVRIRVGSGGGNQPPQAEANGPYTGVVNVPVSFSAAGSIDPDGTITGHQWTFGDGASGTGTSPSHVYTAAGTYRARLTVTDNEGATGIDSATVTVTATGANQPPVAVANGPYSGTVNVPITFTATGSFDPDGGIATYTWFFGDGSSASGATVSRAYSAAGSYPVTLTVVDNLGASGAAQTTATVTSSSSSTPLTWAGAFGDVDADSIVALTITLDLTNDIPETAGPEALASWVVDSLTWDPAVLQYVSFNFGQGAGGSVNPTNAPSGKLLFAGAQSASQNNSGVVTIARIRFRVVGARGAVTTTQSAVGPLLSTATLGAYNYRPKTAIQEATFTVP